MKRLKALIKMEMKPALLVGIYFLLVDLAMMLRIQSDLRSSWRDFLIDGVIGFDKNGISTRMGDLFSQVIIFSLLLFIIGMISLVYVGFKKDKSIEVGRFLKSLPYTMKERCLTKIGVGVTVFSITYLIYAVGMMILRVTYLNKFEEIYRVTYASRFYKEILSSSQLMQNLALVYVACIALYLFVVMFQYLVSNNFASIVIAALVYLSPIFILNSLRAYIQGYYEVIRDFVSWANDLTIIPEYQREASIIVNTVADTYKRDWFMFIGLIGYRLLFYGFIAILAFIVILRIGSTYCIEKSDCFIPNKIFRSIFVIGVTVCGGTLLGDLYNIYSNRNHDVGIYITFIVGAVISFFIARSIARIGIKNRKEVIA